VATTSRTLKQKAYREFKELLIITLYLWVIFGMFIIYKEVILAEHRIDVVAHGIALINAVALAKIMLLARAFHLGDRTDDEPLIYPTLRKSAMFSVLLTCFKILEEIVIGLFRGKAVSQSIADVFGGTWKGTFVVAVFLFVILIPFFGFSELQRVLGEGKLGQLFLHRRDRSKPVSS
jgi:hypothetical protein